MSITVSRSRVKEKCGISDTTYDTVIDNLISELVPAISFAIRDEHIADTGNGGLQSTLTLGATEIVCGEFAAQLLRAPGGGELVKLGVLTVQPVGRDNPADPTGLATQGWARLAPYRKPEPAQKAAVAVTTTPKEIE